MIFRRRRIILTRRGIVFRCGETILRHRRIILQNHKIIFTRRKTILRRHGTILPHRRMILRRRIMIVRCGKIVRRHGEGRSAPRQNFPADGERNPSRRPINPCRGGRHATPRYFVSDFHSKSTTTGAHEICCTTRLTDGIASGGRTAAKSCTRTVTSSGDCCSRAINSVKPR